MKVVVFCCLLAVVFCCLLACSSGAPTTREDSNFLTRQFLNTSKCLDGSNAAYYHSTNTSSRNWIIFLEGGGLCFDELDCAARKHTPLGSSKSYTAIIPAPPGDPILSGQAGHNPDFWTWNRVWIPYCSGDCWTGPMDVAVNPWRKESEEPNEETFYFSGHSILQEVVADLSRKYGLASASNLILSGCSAGGIGTFENVDWVAQALPAVSVHGAPVAGYFGIPFPTFTDFELHRHDPDPYHITTFEWIHNLPQKPLMLTSQPYLDCVNQTNNLTVCQTVPGIYPFIKSPVFILENIVDSYQIDDVGRCPSGVKTKKVEEYLSNFRETMAASLTKQVIQDKPHDGLYAPACFNHCGDLFTGTTIQNKTGLTLLGDWFFGRSDNTALLDPETDISVIRECDSPN